MNTRQQKILRYLYREKKLNIDNLSAEFFVGERTIRNDIKIINDYLDKENILLIKKGIITYTGILPKKDIGKIDENIKIFDLDSEARCHFIEEWLLINNKMNITKFSKENYLSRGTIKSDIEKIRIDLEELNIKIISTKDGIKLLGEEMDIRKKLVSIFNKNNLKKHTQENNFINIKVEKILENLEKEMGKNFQDETFNFMKNYLIISYLRNKNDLTLSCVKNEEFYKSTKEFLKIKRILDDFFSNDFEVIQIIDLFVGMSYKSLQENYLDYWFNFDNQVKELIKRVGFRLKINFIDEIEFFEQLNNHMKPAMYRIKNNLKLKNSIYKEVFENYKKLYLIIEEELDLIENLIEQKFSKDEIAFITMHFQIALEKLELKKMVKKRVVIVCNYGLGTSRVFSNYLKECFEVDIIAIIPYHRLEKFEKIHILDAIITTIDLSPEIEGRIKIDIIKISPILNDCDYSKLEEKGFVKKMKSLEIDTELLFLDLKKEFNIKDDEKLFLLMKNYFPTMKNKIESKISLKDIINSFSVNIVKGVNTWEEAVELSCLPLLKNKSINENYIFGIKDTIKKFGSYMIVKEQFIIPHFKNNEDVFKTDAAFLFLKNPVIFPGDQKVKILFSFSSKDNKEHIPILNELVELLSDDDIYNQMLNLDKKDKLLKLINSSV